MKKILLLVLILSFCISVERLSSDPLEYKLKAVFIQKFVKFVEWPNISPEKNKDFIIGFIGHTPIQIYLTRLIQNKRLKGRTVRVVNISSLLASTDCHVLFISGAERKNLHFILSKIKHRPVLSIADTRGFSRSGVLINFYTKEERVRFKINIISVRQSGLHFSSNLLRLGKIVQRGGQR